jgi:hypothetical protein
MLGRKAFLSLRESALHRQQAGHHHGAVFRRRRLFSTVVEEQLQEMVGGTNTETLGAIARHGVGDACITLNVGGTTFHTLRSTLAANSVIADHVSRAEANSEITRDGAVFIDRDPKHFSFVLQFLRNKAHVEASSNQYYFSKKNLSSSGSNATNLALQLKRALVGDTLSLPKDSKVLSELYQEAAYYRISELQDAICTQGYAAGFYRMFGGSGNPFASAAKLFSRAKAAFIAMGSIGGLHFSTNEDSRNAMMETIQSATLILSGGGSK